jgi:hypothetical protein
VAKQPYMGATNRARVNMTFLEDHMAKKELTR